MAKDWEPALYSRFERERTRPARDLLAQCELGDPASGGRLRIVDLGCGPGNSTALLRERFPDADILGIDTSPAMLDAARRRLPDCRFEQGDIGALGDLGRFDLVFTNAALQWVPDHPCLLPALFGLVAPGGLFAAQVPDNLADPSQTEMRRLAADPEFAPWLTDIDEPAPGPSPTCGPRSTTIRCRTRPRSRTGFDPRASGRFWIPCRTRCGLASRPATRRPWTRPIRRAPTARASWPFRVCSGQRAGRGKAQP